MSFRRVHPLNAHQGKPIRPAALTEGEWVIRLGEAHGDLCSEYRQGAGAGIDAAIDRSIRLLCQWRSERAS